MKNAKQNLRRIVLGTAIGAAAIGGLAGCQEANKVYDHPSLPKIEENQVLVMNEDRSSRGRALDYTLLTDMNNDGQWDVAKRVDCGYTTGDCHVTFYLKQGYGPARSSDANVEFVGPDFFNQYAPRGHQN